MSQFAERHGNLRSVMFSPAEPNIFVATGFHVGALLYDIRYPSRCFVFLLAHCYIRIVNLTHNFLSCSCLFSFPNDNQTTVQAKFDSSGKRLLCFQWTQLAVYDLPTLQHPIVNGNVILTAPDFSGKYWTNPFVFAGLNDELVVAASAKNNGLMIWALPEERCQQDQAVNQPLHVLKGHNGLIRNVRYSDEASAIVSCDYDGIIKLWTPGVPLHPTNLSVDCNISFCSEL